MIGGTYLFDNSGHIVPPAGAPDPVAASGQTLTNGTKDTDTEATVVAGASYAFTAQTVGGFYFGVATIATAANIIWACPLYRTIIISIPAGVTVLHYAADTNSGVGYLRKLAE
jgi:hypothetical protein